MIRLTRETTNDVIVTLTEKGQAANYLLEFYNQVSRVKSYTIQQDTSAHPERYNQLSIKEVATGANPEIGSITLPEGEYKYTIYANSTSRNVDPTGLTVLETGMAIVTDAEASVSEYAPTTTYAAYEE